VGRRLLNLIGTDSFHTVFIKNLCCASRSVDLISQVLESPGNGDDILFILISYSNDHILVLRQVYPCSQEGFIKGLIKAFRNAQTLSCRLHLRSQTYICPSDLFKGEYWHFDGVMFCL